MGSAWKDADVGLLVVIVGLAVVAGRLAGGRLEHLTSVQLRGVLLVAAAAVAQLLHGLSPDPTLGVGLTLASQASLLLFLWLNRYLAGVALVALGSLLNTTVIVANGAMPVAREAILAVSRNPHEVASGRHRLLTDADALPWLTDVIPLPLLRTVVSVGDVILAAGVGLLVVRLMRPPRQRRRGHPSESAA